MTLNEVRDQLVKEYPGRTIQAEAASWFYPYFPNPKDRRRTRFSVTIFRPHSSDGVAYQAEANSPEELLALVHDAITRTKDEPVTATSEPAP